MAANWQIGDCIRNRWEIHKILRGGMGIVYIVYDREDHEAYAAKTFQDEVFARNPATAKRFTQEANTWVNLDIHQNVTRAQFVQTIQGKPLIFLEYVSGGDLSSWINTPRLTEDMLQVLRFALHFCDGMIYALSKGITAHRDVKPQNCLVTKNNILKVTDFGLAKAFDDAEGFEEAINIHRLNTNLTQTGVAAGTSTYMAPEQFDDAKRVDVRADIYSFGVMLYQMIEGRLPFVGRSWEEFALLHKTEKPPALSKRLPEVNTVIQKCLAKSPGDRFSDFVAVRAELADIYEGLTGKPTPQPVAGRELNAIEWSNKGVSLGNLGRYEEQIYCCDRALEINSRFEQALYNKGNALRELGRSEEALVCCDRALEINPRNASAWTNKGLALHTLGRDEEAIVCYDRAIETNPNFEHAWMNKGNALHTLGRYEEAIDCYDRATEINPGFEWGWYNKGTALQESDHNKEALFCYDRVTEINPHFEQVWTNKGVVLRELGRNEEALACYERAIKINSRDANAWTNAGVALKALGKIKEAFACYSRAIEINPHNSIAWANAGVALNDLGKSEEALACFDRVTELDPNAENIWYGKGIVLSKLGRSKEAIVCYGRVVEINPRFEKAWYNMGVMLHASGQNKEALACFDQIIQINPRFDAAWTNKGAALHALGRSEEALACYDQVIAFNPLDGMAWNNKGSMLQALGRREDAVACYDRAIEINPQHGKAWFNKGFILLNDFQRYGEAIICFEEAYKLGVLEAVMGIMKVRQEMGK